MDNKMAKMGGTKLSTTTIRKGLLRKKKKKSVEEKTEKVDNAMEEGKEY